MKIIILNKEAFVKYKGKVGVVLFTQENSLTVNFFDGYSHKKANRTDIGIPSTNEIYEALETYQGLQETCTEYDIAYMDHHTDDVQYLNYCKSYN